MTDISHWSPAGEWWCHRFQKVSPSSEGGRSGEGTGCANNGASSFACAQLEMQMAFMSTMNQLALNMRILNSEGRSGVETKVGAADVGVGEMVGDEKVDRKGKKTRCGGVRKGRKWEVGEGEEP